jgi:hypothetical protein
MVWWILFAFGWFVAAFWAVDSPSKDLYVGIGAFNLVRLAAIISKLQCVQPVP